MKNKKTNQSGFTLIEMLISVAIFATFLSISASSLVNVIKLEQKTNVLRQTQQNARYILETISREARSANGEINSVGERVWPAYSFNNPFNPTILTITSTDTISRKVTQKVYTKTVDTIGFIKKTKDIGAPEENYITEPTTVLNNPNDIKIIKLSFANSKEGSGSSDNFATPPELAIEIEAESGKGMSFVKDEYRAHVEFKTSVSPRNY